MLRRVLPGLALGLAVLAAGCHHKCGGHPLFSKFRRCDTAVPRCDPCGPAAVPAVPYGGAVPNGGVVVPGPANGVVVPGPANGGVIVPGPGTSNFGPTPDVIVPAPRGSIQGTIQGPSYYFNGR